jgi:uncharacterized protein (TIGR02001 family)
VTDYRFRGVSQTSLAPGYQGSLDIDIALNDYVNLFAGVWGSNIRFNGATQLEIDAYGGLKGKLFENKFSWQLQFIGYIYPNTPNTASVHYFEIIPQIGWDFGILEVTGGVALSPNFTAGSGFAQYYFADVKVPVPIKAIEDYKPAVVAGIGYQAVEKNARFGAPDYTTWYAGIGWSLFGFNMSVKYVDTSIRRASCFGGFRLCGATAVFQISKTF